MRLGIFLIGLAICCGYARAQTERAPVGRLFSNPVAGQQSAVGTETETQPSVVAAPRIKVDGFVARSSGRNSVWLNGQVVADRQAPDLNAREIAAVNVDESTHLKVGELLDRETGSRSDILPGQSIAKGKP